MELNSVLLLGNAFLLGLRHGIDWDHIAAITDIVGTATTFDVNETACVGQVQRHALLLSSFYVTGHALVVVVLGIAALSFAAILPSWVDPIMERFVGITLLFLSAFIVYSLIRFYREQGAVRLQSRWMLMFSAVRRAISGLKGKTSKPGEDTLDRGETYGWRTAFGVGLIHGIGAETGTQVLLITALGGASGHNLGVPMLLSFVLGLILSNTLVALLSSSGFAKSVRHRSVCIATGVATAVFSLIVGGFFTLGLSDRLPDMQNLFRLRVI